LALSAVLRVVLDRQIVNVQARQFAQAAVQGWEDDSVASRSKAMESAKAASESAQVLPHSFYLSFPPNVPFILSFLSLKGIFTLQ